MSDERYRERCGHRHGFDVCVLVAGHEAPCHLMLDHDYPESGPRRREYVCEIHAALEAPLVAQDDALPDGWPDRMEMLGQLMEAVGVYNDGLSSPKQLWERSLKAVREAAVLVAHTSSHGGE